MCYIQDVLTHDSKISNSRRLDTIPPGPADSPLRPRELEMRDDIKVQAQPDAFKNFQKWTATTLCYRNMLVGQRYHHVMMTGSDLPSATS